MKRPASAGGSSRAPTAALYRRLALALPGVIEASHMGATDFRVGGRIFATLAYEAKGLGTLKITPEQQAAFLAEAPEWFTPAPGGWARSGATLVRLDAPEEVMRGALATAYHHVAAKAATHTVRASKKTAVRSPDDSRTGARAWARKPRLQ